MYWGENWCSYPVQKTLFAINQFPPLTELILSNHQDHRRQQLVRGQCNPDRMQHACVMYRGTLHYVPVADMQPASSQYPVGTYSFVIHWFFLFIPFSSIFAILTRWYWPVISLRAWPRSILYLISPLWRHFYGRNLFQYKEHAVLYSIPKLKQNKQGFTKLWSIWSAMPPHSVGVQSTLH